ncbi:MAG: M48 family metalloprotease [Pleurocapsa sp.]
MKLVNLLLVVLSILNFSSVVWATPSSEIMAIDAWDEEGEVEAPEEDTEDEEDGEVNRLTPEKMARLKQLATADQLYLAGEKIAATRLYRQVKPAWEIETGDRPGDEIPTPFYDPNLLDPGAKVYWRNYQQGKEQQLESKIFASIELLTQKYPEFIPGHISYAETLKNYDRQTESLEVLEKAVNLYPNESKLVQAKINADLADERWLEASITARQFALFNPQHPEAEEFTNKAVSYLETYRSKLKSQLTWNTIGNVITGTLGFALTGNLFGPISAVETTSMLLRGESAIGEKVAENAKKKLPLLEDEQIVNYVREIGHKIANVSGRDDFNYEFYVIMDEQFNAFALPGGKVFVNTGAILNTDSEAELAGLLAHEIAHAVLSHGFQLVTKGNLTANVVSYIPYVGSTASNLIVLNYSREMEKQADIFGTRMLVGADYAADGVRNLMVKLQEFYDQDQKNNPAPPVWLSTHPDTQARINYMEQLIVNNNLNRYGYEGVSRHLEITDRVATLWQEYQDCLDKLEKKDKNKAIAIQRCANYKAVTQQEEEMSNSEMEE